MEPLSGLSEFALNPRRGDYRGLEELKASLAEHGQQEALTVWRCETGELVVLQGHRRRRAMLDLGWSEALVVERHFASDVDALAWLVSMQEQADAFDPLEKAMAASDLLKGGVGMQRVCQALNRAPQTVQGLLAVLDLPPQGQQAVKDGRLSLTTVEVLRRVEGAEALEAAVQGLLMGSDGEPLEGKAAQAWVMEAYVLPQKRAAEWDTLMRKLKRELSVDHHTFVSYEQRGEYVQGLSGHPVRGYKLASDMLPRAVGDVVTWGDLARQLGVVRYVVAAPLHADRYVVVVQEAAVRQADEVTEQPMLGKRREAKSDGRGGLRDSVQDVEPEEVPVVDEDADAEAEETAQRVLTGLWEAMMGGNKNTSMHTGMWALLAPVLLEPPTQKVLIGGYRLLERWCGGREPLTRLREDTTARAPIRWTAMMLAALALAGGKEALAKEALGLVWDRE